ncbi:MAG: carboxypeptidase-like regulatory domain-containing protein [Bacteroidales bacterium]|nr:carboxypeptidase-like regulatory domain-containing protein [Bacteroidales bacterium]
MFRKLLLVVLAVVFANGVFAQSGTVKGRVIDKATGQPIPFATVVILSGETQLVGTAADFEGNYTLKPIPPGKWTLQAHSVGYKTLSLNGYVVKVDKIDLLDLELTAATQQIEEVQVVAYKVPLIDKDNTQTGETVTAEDIEKMPGRSVMQVASTVAGVASRTGNGVGNIRGARGGNIYFVDGVRVNGSLNIPKAAQEQVQVITGGMSAKYGDVTGGIVSVTTKNASPTFHGSADVETSEFLDKLGHNLGALSFSGPLVKGKAANGRSRTIVGYFLASNFTYNRNPVNSFWPYPIVKEDVRQRLIQQPIVPSPTGVVKYAADFLDTSDFTYTWYHKNNEDLSVNVNAKLSFNFTPNIDLTFGGYLSYHDNKNLGFSNMVFNWDNVGFSHGYTYRIWGRFTQRFSSRTPAQDARSASLIKNAYYQVQAQIEKSFNESGNATHGRDYWKYAYVGKFETTQIETYEWTDTLPGYPNGVMVMNNYKDILYQFTPSDLNPELAAYTSQYYNSYDAPGHYENWQQVIGGGGMLNGGNLGSVYGFFALPGQKPQGYSLGDNTTFRLGASGSADIKSHEISFGFEFEQRDQRSWSVSGSMLWSLARQYVNRQIEFLDWSNPIPVYDANGIFQDTIKYERLYNADGQTTFDKRFREAHGMAVDGKNFIDIFSYDPSEFDITYFSPDELLNNGSSAVGYRGYDLYGNRLKEKPSFEDYFTAQDADGNYLRLVAPYQPIYAAGYIQDKFAFNDLIFNVGVRVDRFDENQYVLKDPYVLYATKRVSDVSGSMNPTGSHPSNMGENYVVYVDDVSDPSTINGYRNGSTWYNAYGVEIEDPAIIASSTGIAPYLVNPDQAQLNEITVDAFEDYTPQIVVMPRISFSFPISDEALFFAHYDILSRRPSSAFNPATYFFLAQNPGATVGNPNLKPQKTIDYELGFQQKLTNTSSLKISAYYREQRDMQQAIRVLGAYPVDYFSYGNIDFGTSKGVSISYDLRRTGNISLRANYTLGYSFATGSSSSQMMNLLRTNQPNLRILAPTNWDQRHKFNINLDIRFFDGKDYNGPVLFGKDILSRAGANFTVVTGSGYPYSRVNGVGEPGLKGSLNGSRLPWTTNIKMRMDKDFVLSKNRSRPVILNIYLDVDNLLNTKNVYSVFAATGDPYDDGYLTSPKMQARINTQNDPEAYIMYYQFNRIANNGYGGPRVTRLGLSINF